MSDDGVCRLHVIITLESFHYVDNLTPISWQRLSRQRLQE